MYATSSALKCVLMHVKNRPERCAAQHGDVVAEAQPRVPEQLRELIGTIVQRAICDGLPGGGHHICKVIRPFGGVLSRPHGSV
jgi:hypothetical protein